MAVLSLVHSTAVQGKLAQTLVSWSVSCGGSSSSSLSLLTEPAHCHGNRHPIIPPTPPPSICCSPHPPHSFALSTPPLFPPFRLISLYPRQKGIYIHERGMRGRREGCCRPSFTPSTLLSLVMCQGDDRTLFFLLLLYSQHYLQAHIYITEMYEAYTRATQKGVCT